jgi:hypothetical protein
MAQKLTDAQIKAKIIANAQSESKSKNDNDSLFPTEIVPLPSKGLVYPLDHPLSSGEVEIRYMTAKDEDILTNPNYLKRGLALDKLYEAIVVGNGKGQPVNMNEMIMGDRSAVMLAARLLGYGSDYDITVTHPDTGKEIPHTVDLNILKPKDIDESLYKNSREFEYELPVSKKVVVFKLQTIVEQKSIEKAIRSQEKAGIPLRNQTTTLKECIVSIDGNDDPKFINSFVDNYLLAKDSLHLRKFMLDINPDFDLTVVIDIPTEDFYQEMALPIDTSFFWPRL